VDGTLVGRRIRHGIGDRKVRGFGPAFPNFHCGEESGNYIDWIRDVMERIR